MDMARARMKTTGIEGIRARVGPARERLLAHPLYRRLGTLEDVVCFMEHHVFAVWDFMSLLKRLQRELTCVGVPWVPTGDPEVRHLVNEIVAGEESDVDGEGRRTSHFEWYVRAMAEAGADPGPVMEAVGKVRGGESVARALGGSGAPAAARDFSLGTFRVAGTGGVHEVASAFTFGREDLIPDLFHGLIERLSREHPGRLERFRSYLQRHIDVDGGEHGGLALRMVEALCGEDEVCWDEAGAAAVAAIEARLRLWDGICARLAGGRRGEAGAMAQVRAMG